MKKLILCALLTTFTIQADPGIMIDIDIIIHGPTGTGGEPEMGDK